MSLSQQASLWTLSPKRWPWRGKETRSLYSGVAKKIPGGFSKEEVQELNTGTSTSLQMSGRGEWKGVIHRESGMCRSSRGEGAGGGLRPSLGHSCRLLRVSGQAGWGRGGRQGGQGTLVVGALHAQMRAWDFVFQTEGSHLHVTSAEQREESKQKRSGRQ